jgi:anti-anti-sigma factor
MTDPQDAPADHPIFETELLQDTLVVMPQARLESLQTDIDRELNRVLDDLLQSGARHMVVDLQRSHYFGTAMLGGIVRLWKRVCTHGGHMALCNVDDDLLNVLRFTKLHMVWPIYGDRQEALDAVHA